MIGQLWVSDKEVSKLFERCEQPRSAAVLKLDYDFIDIVHDIAGVTSWSQIVRRERLPAGRDSRNSMNHREAVVGRRRIR